MLEAVFKLEMPYRRHVIATIKEHVTNLYLYLSDSLLACTIFYM